MFDMRVLPWEQLERKLAILRKLGVEDRELRNAESAHAAGKPYTIRMIELPPVLAIDKFPSGQEKAPNLPSCPTKRD